MISSIAAGNPLLPLPRYSNTTQSAQLTSDLLRDAQANLIGFTSELGATDGGAKARDMVGTANVRLRTGAEMFDGLVGDDDQVRLLGDALRGVDELQSAVNGPTPPNSWDASVMAQPMIRRVQNADILVRGLFDLDAVPTGATTAAATTVSDLPDPPALTTGFDGEWTTGEPVPALEYDPGTPQKPYW